jgi:hypothetical protein
MPEYIIISNSKIKGWSSYLTNARNRAKLMAEKTGADHAVFKYVSTYNGGSGRESRR